MFPINFDKYMHYYKYVIYQYLYFSHRNALSASSRLAPPNILSDVISVF